MATDRTLTADRLREVLDYDPETGMFRWRSRKGRRSGRDGVAGCTKGDSGYRIIRVDYTIYYAHRLAWLYMHGVWPTVQIDHVNGDCDDNRMVNLREATGGQNKQNSRRPHRDSRSGFLGVFPWSGRWAARIMVDGRTRHLGVFDTPEEASNAYLAAKRELHPFWIEAD